MFEMPEFGSNTGGTAWNEPSNYSFDDTGQGGYEYKYEPEPENDPDLWFTDTYSDMPDQQGQGQQQSAPPKEEVGGGFWGSLWDWAKSPQGTAVVGGAIGELYNRYQKEDNMRLQEKYGGESGPSAAELHDARVGKHNESINKPMDMGVRKFKKG